MPRVSKRTKKSGNTAADKVLPYLYLFEIIRERRRPRTQRFHLYSETDLRGFCKETSGNADYESLYR